MEQLHRTSTGTYPSHLNRWWEELKEYGRASPNAPMDPFGHVLHHTGRLIGGAIHAVTEGPDALFDDLTGSADSGVKINRMPSGPFPRIRRTIGETLDALVRLKPFTFLSKGFSLLGKWIPDSADFVLRNYRSHARSRLQGALSRP